MSARKKSAIVIRVAVTYGISAWLRSRFCRCTSVLMVVRISTQNSSEPCCPPQSDAILYGSGSVVDEYEATYSSEKSSMSSARQSTAAAIATRPWTTYAACRLERTRSVRRIHEPASAVATA